MPNDLLRTLSPTKHKRKPSMADAKPLPYRDVNNSSVAYAAPTGGSSAPAPYDSDCEALIPSTSQEATLSPEEQSRFTATGRPMPAFKHSGMQNWAGDMYTLPQLLPKRYTDESIIPGIVVDVIPREGGEARKEKKGWIAKMKGEVERKEAKLTKVVYMPRGEYLKWFARDQGGMYIGSEEYRRWTEEELDEDFGKYQPAVAKQSRKPKPEGTMLT